MASRTAPRQDPVEVLRGLGLRMTPQRRAIVAEVMASDGHISPPAIARRVRDRVPGVNPSTVYRTLSRLEEAGILSHAHLESGAEYHHRADSEHVHLTCSRCGRQESLSLAEAGRLRGMIAKHHRFQADLTHFAISGLCARCQGSSTRAASRGRRPARPPARRPRRAPARARRAAAG